VIIASLLPSRSGEDNLLSMPISDVFVRFSLIFLEVVEQVSQKEENPAEKAGNPKEKESDQE
jgi:hypothetical protein